MESGLEKESFLNSPRSTPPLSASCFAAFSCAACINSNVCRRASCRTFCHGSIPAFLFLPESLSPPQNSEQLERLARYITRPPLAADSIRRRDDGLLQITTPPDPRTGSTVRLLDPLDWIHAVTAHIPDRGRHCVRYYGALANRARSPKTSSEQQTAAPAGPGASADSASEFVQRRRASWARLIKKIFEADPLLCPCGATMKIISFITEPRVVDRILRHLQSDACKVRNPFEPRGPPAAARASPPN